MSQGGAVVEDRDVVVRDVDAAALVQLDAVVAPLEGLVPEVPLPGATEESHQLPPVDVPPGKQSLPCTVSCRGFDVDMQDVPEVTEGAVLSWDVSSRVLESKQPTVGYCGHRDPWQARAVVAQ